MRDYGIIGLRRGCGDDFHHFAAKLACPFHQGLQHRQRRRPLKIVVRADEHGAPLAAGFTDASAHGGGRFHFQIRVLGTGLDGPLQQRRSLGLFRKPAGGYERNVRLGEQPVYLLFLQGTAVQADFRHF